MNLFGETLTKYYVTHPDWNYAVMIEAADDNEAFASMAANRMPAFNEGGRYYTNPSHKALQGLRIVPLAEWREGEIITDDYDDDDVSRKPKK